MRFALASQCHPHASVDVASTISRCVGLGHRVSFEIVKPNHSAAILSHGDLLLSCVPFSFPRLDDFQSHLDEAVFAWGGEVAEHLLLRTSHLSEADQGNIEKVWEHYSNTSIDKSIKSQGRKETTELLTLHLGTLWHVAKQLSEQLVLTRQEITCLLQLEL